MIEVTSATTEPATKAVHAAVALFVAVRSAARLACALHSHIMLLSCKHRELCPESVVARLRCLCTHVFRQSQLQQFIPSCRCTMVHNATSSIVYAAPSLVSRCSPDNCSSNRLRMQRSMRCTMCTVRCAMHRATAPQSTTISPLASHATACHLLDHHKLRLSALSPGDAEW